ncbi:hypothetical protein [Hoeflea alexandrii]|uniref:hypothetical protein n=1 Tax=Hoeflea alexandrii TaxID=288436 RepID=UPI002270A79D|nr:hypothetical protein [Hoeflea alexandrii]MCY0155032.1 hypothetical protein [Hoeflea alexandrii]
MLELALEAAIFFNLTTDAARRLAREMARQINAAWRDIIHDHGVTGADMRSLEPTFEHEEMNGALALSLMQSDENGAASRAARSDWTR